MALLKQTSADKLRVEIYDTRDAMGCAAATAAAERLRKILAQKGEANVIFAAAPSQNETLKYLAQAEGIDWTRVRAFHMDEYIGLPVGAPQAFGTYLNEHIFSLLPFRSVAYLNGQAADPVSECARYSALLREYPVDLVCLGIGENGHIAFNDPWAADFRDPALVKVTPLDEICRQQQVNDGCFASIERVPTHAMTLTIPALTNAKHLVCTVPAATKAWAVKALVTGEITEQVPATAMRLHDDATLFCDKQSGEGIL